MSYSEQMKYRLGVMSLADLPERKKLIDHLPPFMQSFGEIRQIMGAEEPWIEHVCQSAGKILDNAFIEDCDEYGLRKYESLLGILPESGDTLETRKARVKIRWNDFAPYSYRALVRKLNACCGVNGYDLDADLENYGLSVVTRLSVPAEVLEVEAMVECMLPMNMYFETFNRITRELDAAACGFGAVVTHKTVAII